MTSSSLFLGDSRFTKKTYLMNAYATKGVIKENGVAFDSTTVWLMTPQQNPTLPGNQPCFGLGYESCKWGTSENFEKIKHINFLATGPILVEVELEDVQKGTGEKEKKLTVVHNIKLLGMTDMVKDAIGKKAA
jgi:hypothetical protein